MVIEPTRVVQTVVVQCCQPFLHGNRITPHYRTAYATDTFGERNPAAKSTIWCGRQINRWVMLDPSDCATDRSSLPVNLSRADGVVYGVFVARTKPLVPPLLQY